MTKTIKHLFLICILVIIPNGCHRQPSEQNVAAENDCTDIVPLMRPAKSKTAAYLDSLGFINIAEADSSIGIDLMYTRANNFTGQVLYEDLHEAYLHPEALKSLLQAQKRLKEICPGYSLIVYDAARPMFVQQKMGNMTHVPHFSYCC